MNRPGAGPQPLRNLVGFPGQQAPQARNAPLSSGRLQNGKLATTSNWGAGIPIGAPGLPTPQSRVSGGASSSFAQTLNGSQPATPLDPSEFPSLSGVLHPQYQNPSQAIWANANQRASQHTPVQRPQQSQGGAIGSIQSQQQSHLVQESLQQQHDESFFPSSQLGNAVDDYRHGGQGGIGPLSGSNIPQTTNIDDFPPLGRNGHGEIGQDRRGNIMQSAVTGLFPNNSAFSGGPPISRTPAEALRQGQNETGEQAKTNGNNENSLFSTLQDSQVAMKPDSFAEQQRMQVSMQNHAQEPRPQQYQSGYGGDLVESPRGVQQRTKTPLSQMSELDRYGLPGLLEMIRNEDPNVSSLAIGHDLTSLGLDLNSSEPLHPTFAGPFAPFPTRPLQPDFTLPQCYTVDNVHKLEEKMPSFSDETLFYMFYTMPRDVMQEVSAIELTGRNWRYHKELRVWLTKDLTFEAPQPISSEAERGRYIVFNEKLWQRESRDMILRYADLDTHITERQSGPLSS